MSDESIKIAVLEQRLLDFANVVSKIDDAITKLSDVNANITKMLAVHEERIEQCNKSDNLIIRMIDDLKMENSTDHKKVNERIDDVEEIIGDIKKDVNEVSKIKWMTVGSGIVLAVLATSMSTLASGWWTPSGMQDHYKIITERNRQENIRN